MGRVEMRKKGFTVVANWKMQLSFKETIEYISQNQEEFINLKRKNISVIVCPSFEVLYSTALLLSKDDLDVSLGARPAPIIEVGGQDCSAFKKGAYTGQVSAKSLFQVGCSSCIIGHNEQRQYACQRDEVIAQKAVELLENGLKPIICIGESLQNFENKKTCDVLENQLETVLSVIAESKAKKRDFYIAYEPVWAIGTGKRPSLEYVDEVIAWIDSLVVKKGVNQDLLGILYGGSVVEKTVCEYTQLQKLSGFLVGGVSLDFQKFQNIVNLLSNI